MVAEWSKAADCKSVSNITLVRIQFISFINVTNLNNYNKNTYNYKIYKFSLNTFKHHKRFKELKLINISRIYNNKNFFKYLNSNNKNFFKVINTFFSKGNMETTTNNVLQLNFKRDRFFPTLFDKKKKHTYITSSLGIFKKFFNKPKSFKKSKQLYLVLIHFFRKVIIFSNLYKLSLHVKFTPKFLTELINLFTQKNKNTYQHPFSSDKIKNVDEKNFKSFFIQNIVFINNKTYGTLKVKKKGTPKRRVLRKVIKNNSITD